MEDDDDLSILSNAFELYRSFVDYTQTLQKNGKNDFIIPRITKELIMTLCDKVKQLFKNDQPLVTVNFPCAIIGDLHGNIYDLVRIISKYGMPIAVEYIFLGDYVDRGQFSLETLVFILLLKWRFPRKVHMIRGNHEFPSREGPGYFRTDLQDLGYTPDVYDAFVHLFEEIPIAALLTKDILCVHGGIGPGSTLESLKMLKYPLCEKKNDNIMDFLWSDPTELSEDFDISPRGKGWLFGRNACSKFLSENNLKRIIRGHSFIETGFKSYFHGSLLTIYSTSRSIKQPNIGATLYLKSFENYNVDYYDPLPPIYRSQVKVISELPRLLPLPMPREKRTIPVVPVKICLVRRHSLTQVGRRITPP